MAGFVVPLRMEIRDSLTGQGMQNTKGLHRKGQQRGKEKNEFFLREHANKS